MSVEIVLDPAGLVEPRKSDLVVSQVADYVPVVQRIKEATRTGLSLRVLVRHPVCAEWLKRFAGAYQEADLRCTTASARVLLAERWQTTIPETVSDEAIVASRLLEAGFVPKGGQSYADIILANYWGEFFTHISFPFSQAADLVESVDTAHWEANRGLLLVTQTLQTRRQQWLDRARRPEQRHLIDAVFDDPHALRARMGSYKVLRRYPSSLGKAVLGQWYDRFKDIELDPDPIRIAAVDVSDAIQQVVYYLNDLTARLTGPADLEAVLDQMSGSVPEEFRWLREQLKTKQSLQPISAALLQRIVERFRPIQDQVQREIDSLRAAIPPKYPSAPAADWSADQWLSWSLEQYLPYRFWLEDNDRWDAVVAAYASTYADWLYEHYTELRYEQQERWVSDVLNQVGLTLQQGRKVLLLLIDNLNFKYLRLLQAAFARHGFRATGDVQPLWAMLPTTTEVSKHSLVAGQADLRKVQGSGYEDILAKDWQLQLRGHEIAYLSKLGLLRERQSFDADLILLNYLPIDDVLHKDERQIGTTHTAQIEGHLQAMVDEVVRFARRARVEQEIVVAIASDHGSTKILAGPEHLLDDKFYARLATDRHHRYIAVPEERAVNPTSYDQEHCYVLPGAAFGNRESYFIPRGYGVFIRTTESIYVHGGLTPEETLVPFLRLVKSELRVQQPSLKLPVNVVRYGVKANLLFTVGNPNDAELQNLTLRIAESDLPGVQIDAVPAGRAIEVTIPVRIRRRPGAPNLTEISVQGGFDYRGQAYTLEPVSIPVELRALMDSTDPGLDLRG